MPNLNPNGSVAGNAQNIPEAHVPRTRSTFPLKRHFFNTHRFGEYIPHFFADLNKDEDFPINSSSILRTYTLKSPLMQNVTRNKDYFLVPMEAILPNNWEKFFDNPVRGDDVLDDVGPTVENFWSKVSILMNALFTGLQTYATGTSPVSEIWLQSLFRFFIFGEYFYSNGSLLSSLGCHGAPYVVVTNQNTGELATWDDYFDYFCDYISSILAQDATFTLQVDGYSYVVSNRNTEFGFESISLRHALQLMRDNAAFVITYLGAAVSGSSSPWYNFVSHSYQHLFYISGVYEFADFSFSFENANVDCNLSRLWAYQLSVAHYMTNDHIDFVYSAELYRQLIGNYISKINNNIIQNSLSFTRNGITYRYDWLSAHFCSKIFDVSVSSGYPVAILGATSSGYALNILGYFSALFGYRRSLRYLDYFTGSRAQPLAVVNTAQINTNVSVNSNQVSVIDITKSIQAQRFLNSVNRVRHNFEGYLKGIFGGEVPAPDYHNPFKLAHTDDVVFGQETENTGSAQLDYDSSTGKLSGSPIAVTTNLRSHSGNYVFQIHTDRPCIAIGITSYEIPRIYTKSIDRTFFHKNRFDWFNPFMQYIGDQPIWLQELGIKPGSGALNSMANFSYTIRHEEYKQWFHIGSGGFGVPSTNLDNWIFPAIDRRGTQYTINPDWIRSLNAEFDRFYVSLSGWSLGTYFHFIVDDFNSCNASRPMAFAPQVLG